MTSYCLVVAGHKFLVNSVTSQGIRLKYSRVVPSVYSYSDFFENERKTLSLIYLMQMFEARFSEMAVKSWTMTYWKSEENQFRKTPF